MLDGTQGFIRKGQYCIALALMEDDQPVLGVLGCPNLGSSLESSSQFEGVILVGEKDHGAFQYNISDLDSKNTLLEADAVRISCSHNSDLARIRTTESFEVRGFARQLNQQISAELKILVPSVKMDSQCKYAVVARGDSDLYLRLSSASYAECIWDHAAGAIVVQSAGGIVTDFRGKALDFSVGRRLRQNQGIVCSNIHIHNTVIECIRRLNPLDIFGEVSSL